MPRSPKQKSPTRGPKKATKTHSPKSTRGESPHRFSPKRAIGLEQSPRSQTADQLSQLDLSVRRNRSARRLDLSPSPRHARIQRLPRKNLTAELLFDAPSEHDGIVAGACTDYIGFGTLQADSVEPPFDFSLEDDGIAAAAVGLGTPELDDSFEHVLFGTPHRGSHATAISPDSAIGLSPNAAADGEDFSDGGLEAFDQWQRASFPELVQLEDKELQNDSPREKWAKPRQPESPRQYSSSSAAAHSSVAGKAPSPLRRSSKRRAAAASAAAQPSELNPKTAFFLRTLRAKLNATLGSLLLLSGNELSRNKNKRADKWAERIRAVGSLLHLNTVAGGAAKGLGMSAEAKSRKEADNIGLIFPSIVLIEKFCDGIEEQLRTTQSKKLIKLLANYSPKNLKQLAQEICDELIRSYKNGDVPPFTEQDNDATYLNKLLNESCNRAIASLTRMVQKTRDPKKLPTGHLHNLTHHARIYPAKDTEQFGRMFKFKRDNKKKDRHDNPSVFMRGPSGGKP